jgi:hypothetical protein
MPVSPNPLTPSQAQAVAQATYCLGATVDGRSWSLVGPGSKQWYTNDDRAAGTETTL